jgi:hypothetical protein
VKQAKFIEEISKINKTQNKRLGLGVAVPVLTTIGAFIASNIYATKLQIDGSKNCAFSSKKGVGRSKYFVNYTPEQVEQAKENLENNNDKKSKKKRN